MPYASAGEPFGWKPFAKPPLQGEVDAPFGADGGVHCRLAAEISCKIRQDIALCFAGDDAGIIPEPCGGFVGRAKTPALQSRRERATTDKSQPSARSVGGPMQASAPTQGGDHAVGAAQQRRHRPLRRGKLPLPAPLHVYVIL